MLLSCYNCSFLIVSTGEISKLYIRISQYRWRKTTFSMSFHAFSHVGIKKKELYFSEMKQPGVIPLCPPNIRKCIYKRSSLRKQRQKSRWACDFKWRKTLLKCSVPAVTFRYHRTVVDFSLVLMNGYTLNETPKMERLLSHKFTQILTQRMKSEGSSTDEK